MLYIVIQACQQLSGAKTRGLDQEYAIEAGRAIEDIKALNREQETGLTTQQSCLAEQVTAQPLTPFQ